jgi:hypothetical protein
LITPVITGPGHGTNDAVSVDQGRPHIVSQTSIPTRTNDGYKGTRQFGVGRQIPTGAPIVAVVVRQNWTGD